LTPASWLRVTVAAPHAAGRDLIAEALVAAGGAAVLHEGDRLTTYLPLSDAAPAGSLSLVRECVRNAGLPAEPTLEWEVEADRDWATEWKAGLRARRVGRRFLLRPPWVKAAPAPGVLSIVVEPGMAFGTGEHATTRGAIRLLEEAVEPGHRVLDAGTGSGILAIAAALLGARPVLAVDVDPCAVEVARENARVNGVSDAVHASVAAVDGGFLADGPTFDVIAANILSGVLIPLLPAFRDALSPGGSLVLAGILEEQSGTFAAAAEAAGFGPPRVDVEQGWWSARLVRRATGGGSVAGRSDP